MEMRVKFRRAIQRVIRPLSTRLGGQNVKVDIT